MAKYAVGGEQQIPRLKEVRWIHCARTLRLTEGKKEANGMGKFLALRHVVDVDALSRKYESSGTERNKIGSTSVKEKIAHMKNICIWIERS